MGNFVFEGQLRIPILVERVLATEEVIGNDSTGIHVNFLFRINK